MTTANAEQAPRSINKLRVIGLSAALIAPTILGGIGGYFLGVQEEHNRNEQAAEDAATAESCIAGIEAMGENGAFGMTIFAVNIPPEVQEDCGVSVDQSSARIVAEESLDYLFSNSTGEFQLESALVNATVAVPTQQAMQQDMEAYQAEADDFNSMEPVKNGLAGAGIGLGVTAVSLAALGMIAENKRARRS